MAERSLLRICVCSIPMLMCIIAADTGLVAEPSSQLQAALSVKVGAMAERHAEPLSFTVTDILLAAGEGSKISTGSVGMEYEYGRPSPCATCTLPEGNVSSLLDRAADGAGYAWQANGDWINLVPKAKLSDPGYIMNQRIPGRVVLSLGSTKMTVLTDWLKAHNITTATSGSVMSREDQDATPSHEDVVLNDPTLRECYNAWESLYGHDRWSVQVKVTPDPNGKSPPRILLLSTAYTLRQAAPATLPAK